MIRHSCSTRAFSLLEILVAVAIIAALFAILGISYISIQERNKLALEMTTLRNMGATLHSYIADNKGRLPNNHSPAIVKILAQHLGYVNDPKNWSNDSSSPKNSIFKDGANEAAIRAAYTSQYDPRTPPDPLNGFSSNEYMGFNPNPNAEGKANAIFYTEITNPEEKLYFVPSWFTNLVGKDRFSASTANTPFVTDRNPNYKGKFPALFASGRVALMDQDPVRHQGISINAAHNRWILPKK